MRIFSDTAFVVLLLHLAQGSLTVDLKTWIPDTNWNNPRNWDNGLLPCKNSRIILPADGCLVSLLSSSMEASELVLPLDGQLVFGNDAQLKLTGGVPGSPCSAKDVHFVVSNVKWYDPDNWNMSSWRVHTSSSGMSGDSAVPHAYRVPCRTDHVTFTAGKSFKVHVEGNSVVVATMSINNVYFSNQEMSNFLLSQTGNFLFPGNPDIKIMGNVCLDPSGCMCGNDELQVLKLICKHKAACPAIKCSDPIQPVGQCCKICGSSIVMEYMEHFEISKLLDLHNSYLRKSQFQAVLSYTGKTYEDMIQAIFIDGEDEKGAAANVAEKVYKTLLNDIETAKFYKLRSVDLHSSVNWNADVTVHGSQARGMSAGGVIGVVFAAVAFIISGIIGALYMYRKRNIPGFSFARFDLNVGKVDLELCTTPHDELEPDEPPPAHKDNQADKAFDNPIYGQASTSEKENFSVEPSANADQFAENPIFNLCQDKEETEDYVS